MSVAAAPYRFSTTWEIEAAVEDVWDVLVDTPHWPQWWRYVRQVDELEQGDGQGLGALRRFRFRSALPYELEFAARITVVDPPARLGGQAAGELEGGGRCELVDLGSSTLVTVVWEVAPTRLWMRVLGPLARPFFSWNHDRVMAAGARGMAGLLETRLLRLPRVGFPWSALLGRAASLTAGLVLLTVAARRRH